MRKEFIQFVEAIRLTIAQENDAITKYDGVCKKLHDAYYDTEYNGSTKYLFGSYKTKVNVRPLTKAQDVDVIFKITKETLEKFQKYESNGPAALLQEIKDYLKDKYTTTDVIKAWGKVVLIEFSDGHHNVEIVPGYENEDGTFTIPNSENGGTWDTFDPKAKVDAFQTSNTTTNNLTADLSRILKTWKNCTPSVQPLYKSYQIVDDVIQFLGSEFTKGAGYEDYHKVIKNFFEFIKKSGHSSIASQIDTALERINKAIGYMNENKPQEASEEWRKVFGKDGQSEFPLVTENPVNESKPRVFSTGTSPWAK